MQTYKRIAEEAYSKPYQKYEINFRNICKYSNK